MEEQTHMTVSERTFAFIDARKDKSAAGLAKLLGVSTGQTTSWRQRNCDPPVKYLPQICEYLGVSIAFLVTGEEAKVDLAKVLAEDEAVLLERYRSLDADGREIVRATALQEQRRAAAEKGLAETHVG